MRLNSERFVSSVNFLSGDSGTAERIETNNFNLKARGSGACSLEKIIKFEFSRFCDSFVVWNGYVRHSGNKLSCA